VSGILGLYNLDGKPVESSELRNMASLLMRRGPDRTGVWQSGPIGLGQTLLAATPEMLLEDLPLEHAESGCVITGDIRLDNREELLTELGLGDREVAPGDAGLALAAYLEWGEGCVEHFLGDFAFAVWDPRGLRLFCARDQMGMRQLIYHLSPGRFFAFATEPRAILVLPQVPYRINEARIADYLVKELEGIDKTNTFFEEVHRLPPAHTLTVTPEGIRQRRYWALEAGPELRLASDDEYAEAFLEVFTEAVRCRLRTVGRVGSMLSGGIDSGSVVAVAGHLLAAEHRGPLLTFSAISPDGEAEPETRAIRATLTMDGLEPTTVSYGEFDQLLPELEQLAWDVDEPFDGSMTLVRAVYLAARRRGLRMLLDGVGGDNVLTEGRRLARLLRAGRWRTAYREAAGHNRYWQGAFPPRRELLGSARAAFVPDVVLRRLRRQRQRRRIARRVRSSPISPEFAQRMDVGERLRIHERNAVAGPLSEGRAERARSIEHPYLTVGRERYDRVAGAVGIEPRDPFLDLRVLSFCVSLPDGQMLTNGWPKSILRHATADLLPDEVRWRCGREHLGWAFTNALLDGLRDSMRRDLESNLAAVGRYVGLDGAESCRDYLCGRDAARASNTYDVLLLAEWLRRHADRPLQTGRPVGEGEVDG
jgi:asparagine synthase (glutamine-hydrolysing)